MNVKLQRYRSLILETRKENDELFTKIKEFIANGDFSDSDEMLDLFNISRDPVLLLQLNQIQTSPLSPMHRAGTPSVLDLGGGQNESNTPGGVLTNSEIKDDLEGTGTQSFINFHL